MGGTKTPSVFAAQSQLPRGGSPWHGGKVSGLSAKCLVLTGGVFPANIRALSVSSLALSVTCGDSSPKGGALGSPRNVSSSSAKCAVSPEPLPLGEVDANAVSRRRGLARSPQRGCFRRKPALQMPLSSTTLLVKMQCRTARRLPGIALIKIILPLFMRRANAERILNRFTGRRGSGCTPPWKRNGRGCARPSDGWWTGPWAHTGPPTGSGGWRCRAAPACPAG